MGLPGQGVGVALLFLLPKNVRADATVGTVERFPAFVRYNAITIVPSILLKRLNSHFRVGNLDTNRRPAYHTAYFHLSLHTLTTRDLLGSLYLSFRQHLFSQALISVTERRPRSLRLRFGSPAPLLFLLKGLLLT